MNFWAFRHGCKARLDGYKLDEYPFRNEKSTQNKKDWEAGWTRMDEALKSNKDNDEWNAKAFK